MTNEQINDYSSYIYSIMKRFKNYKNKEDLFQAGCIGLINAYNRFDPSIGAKFTTYAYLDILGEMYKVVLQARTRNAGWRIDYFITSKQIEKKIKDAIIYSEIYGSDHCPVGLEIEI